MVILLLFEDLEDDAAISTDARLAVQSLVATILEQKLTTDDYVARAIERSGDLHHIMEFTSIRAINTLFSLLRKACRSVLEYNIQHTDFPLEDSQIETYMLKKVQ